MQSNEEMVNRLKERYPRLPTEILDAFKVVDRRWYTSESCKDPYDLDIGVPIGDGQKISAPDTIAIMCLFLHLKKGQKVLAVGTGSGYHDSIVAEIIYPGKVFTLEIREEFANLARENIARAKEKSNRNWNIEVINADGSGGYKEEAPYDRIYYTAGIPKNFPTKILFDQLVDEGIFFIPESKGYFKWGYKINGGVVMDQKPLGLFGFDELIGKYGFE